ncbi:MAG TPA: hypothetical protein VK592_04070 [Candidatus Dormibacteraeota bacterium]|nr:hypothetical protein [Candidatus Dormibacteraeota bacterium]
MELTLLGYALDPRSPLRGNGELVEDLAGRGTLDRILEGSAAFGGRWALVVAEEVGLHLLTDATGLRQVFYTAGVGSRWCASQASLIAAEAGIARDPEASAFLGSLYVRAYSEFWWPFDTSPFRGVRRLPPNHVLDLERGEVTRYWPVSAPAPRPFERVVDAGAELLRGSLEAAANRAPLALTLTAGLDTRVLLAAARDLRSRAVWYTLDPRMLHTSPADLDVAARLSARLGLTHLVIGRGPKVPDYRRLYAESVDAPHAAWATVGEGLWEAFPPERMAVFASSSEIARAPEHWHDSPRRVTPGSLVAFANMSADESGLARTAFGRWLEDAGPSAERSGYHPLMLFYWENRIGSWLATGVAEWDLIHETCAPFSCRHLLETLLASDVADRRGPACRLHHALVERMWPEALLEPVNPLSRGQLARQSAKRGLFRAMRVTRTYRPLMGAYLRRRSRRMERL